MPPRDDELPEGTDHIINGAMETGGGDAGTGTGGGAAAGGGSSSGFIGATGGDGTGGTATGGGGTNMTATEGTGGGGDTGIVGAGGTSTGAGGDMTGGGLAATGGADTGTGGGGGGNVGEQLKGQIYNLRDQAGGKVRTFAEDGKTRATDMLEELSRVVADTADSIDERLGNNYGEYARKAADGVSSFAENLRGKEVDELYDNVRSAVRKSPGIAIGIAAVVGFTLVRLVKAGMPEDGGAGAGGGDGRRTDNGGTGA
ncbi:MAG TPA: hypothetical protein VF619_12080 [Allosphingosinicella sp.]|jgi:ElaB/YqjD/DUF883 family membrane-anchored ribosome-binding protein